MMTTLSLPLAPHSTGLGSSSARRRVPLRRRGPLGRSLPRRHRPRCGACPACVPRWRPCRLLVSGHATCPPRVLWTEIGEHTEEEGEVRSTRRRRRRKAGALHQHFTHATHLCVWRDQVQDLFFVLEPRPLKLILELPRIVRVAHGSYNDVKASGCRCRHKCEASWLLLVYGRVCSVPCRDCTQHHEHPSASPTSVLSSLHITDIDDGGHGKGAMLLNRNIYELARPHTSDLTRQQCVTHTALQPEYRAREQAQRTTRL